MNSRWLKRSLRGIVGSQSVLDDAAGLAAYAYDSSLHSATPDLVLLPQTSDQVAQIVKLLHREGVPYVARGAGTNLSGGSIATVGGAVLALGGMKRILSIEPENFSARVEPGVTNLELQEALARFGFFFAPDPASQKVSTIGGNVAENSGGPHCLKYGVTTNNILAARIVTPEGELIDLGSDTPDAPGCDLLGLFVGSEGTLGIATEITCRILPVPQATRTMLAVFDSTETASNAVSEIIAAGIVPATLEMMDNLVIRAVEESLRAGYPTDAAAVLIIEVDGIEEGLGETVAEIERICRRNNVRELRTAQNERERDQLWAGRRGAFGAVARLFPNYSVSDGTVPRTKLPGVLRRIAEIGEIYQLQIGNVFHAGDGNLHPLVFFDSRDRRQVERVHCASEEILRACADVGGTISGEHGVGSEKIGAMALVFGRDEIELMRKLKQSLDPNGVCNPNKILPPTTEPERRGRPRDAIGCIESADGPPGIRTYSPSHPDEVAALLSKLGKNGTRFAAVGSMTLFRTLPMNPAPEALVDMKRLRSIGEHDAANLTVTVQAGLTLEELQKSLAERGQFLPLDAPPEATLGGVAASALPGPRRHLYGAARDLVLGLTFVTAEGRALTAGGKTIKNVAGYDFGKLLIGSWGALGVITDLTFRLLPLARTRAAVVANFEELGQACGAANSILGLRLSPSLIALSKKWGLSLFFGAEGGPAAVRRQIDTMTSVCAQHGAEVSETHTGTAYDSLVSELARMCYSSNWSESLLSVCAGVRCGEIARTLNELTAMESEWPTKARYMANMAGGCIYINYPKPTDSDLVSSETIFRRLQERLSFSHITVLSAASGPGSDIPFITRTRNSGSWSSRIKACFDPVGVMNPGLKI